MLLGELGAGGMDRVLEARDPDLRRTVAIKVVANPKQVTEEQLARFVAEAQVTSQLQHPNIVPVHDVGITPDGHLYFVMKKVEGRSLREVVQALRAGVPADHAHFTLRRLLAMFVQVCNAVAYAHELGVVHRDLKPDNVMVGRFGEVLVMDWGVSRVMGDRTEAAARGGPGGSRTVTSPGGIERMELPQTMDGVAVGTPGYMSPEQALGDLSLLDGRSDVWSLGAILYELVTWERAFVGENVYHLLLTASRSLPDDPRVAAPARRVPDEVAEIVLKALRKEREDRYGTALELAAAVEDFLEGSRRREAAKRHLDEARRAWRRHGALTEELEELTRAEKELAESIPRWAPLSEKTSLLRLRDRLRAIEPERSTAFGDVLGHCEKALSQDPENRPARAFLADVFVRYFLDSEGTPQEQHFAERVKQYDDDGRHAALLEGTGRFSLTTSPSGAEVVARQVIRDGLVWRTAPPIALGTTPIVDHPLGHGSWLMTLRSPGKRDTTYPVHLDRCGRWDGPTVPLYSDAEIGEGWVYVPPGPTLVGGDELAVDGFPRGIREVDGFFASVFPVTNEEYCAFLNGLHAREPGSASAHCPRKESYLEEGVVTRLRGGSLYWTEPAPDERWVVPQRDDDGDAWGLDWPVFGITWEDAWAYARWMNERMGLPPGSVRLPFEHEWSKMARGADGRFFPWGNEFDPALCKMRHSREGRPVPESVGAFPSDVSVYGVRDLAGGIRELCGEDSFDGDPDRRPTRAGSWRASEVPCRAAYRYGQVWWQVFTSIGFRLIRNAPPPAPSAGPEPARLADGRGRP
jgi:serine/threonine protein kinase/formylglycine-generating enzyme required for sulfatase activity